MLNIEKPKLLNVIEGASALSGSFTGRPSHGLIFKLSGESVYRFDDFSLRLGRGEVLYIPKGTRYSYGKTSSEDSRYVLINFLTDAAPTKPEKYRLDGVLDFDDLCQRLSRQSLLDTPQEQYRSLALFYRTLDGICEAEKSTTGYNSTVHLIAPAASYLQNHIYDPELRVGELHTLCGISDTYFRKLFIRQFGVSPKQYVLQLRLRRARDILNHGEYNTVSQVAKQVGFEDPLYFSKQFRAAYGCTPTAIRK
jgi:AraC-like DNA-binding protein